MTGLLDVVERAVADATYWLRLCIEAVGAVCVAVGFGYAVVQLALLHIHNQTETFLRIRVTFTRYLSVGLEFQLAADILSTAIAPTWTELGKLGATATIRTALNYFLSRDARQDAETQE